MKFLTARQWRLAATATIAALSVGTMAACSPAAQPTPASPQQSASDTPKELSGKVTVWSWTAPAKGLRAAIPGFTALHPGVTVDVQDVGNPAIWDKITTGMAADGAGLADVLNIGIDYMGNYVEKFPGKLSDLRDYGLGKLESEFPAGAWKSGTGANGEVYGVPYEVNATGFFYRTDIFKDAGVDPASIKTWDDLLAAGKTIKDKTGTPLFSMDKAATVADSAGMWQLLTMLQGSFYFNAAGDIVMNGPAGVKSLEIIKKANDMGIVADIPGSWDNLVLKMKGKKPVATFTDGGWMAGEIAIDAPEMKGKWGVSKPPSVEAGGSTAAINGGTYLSIANSSKNREAAAAFIDYALGTMDGQKTVYKGGGMFPGYKPFIGSPEFTQPVPFYNDQPVNQIFIDQLQQQTPVVNYTSDYSKALKAYTDAQTKVLLEGADPKQALDAAAQQVAQQTQRKIAS